MNYEEFKQELKEKFQRRVGSRYIVTISKAERAGTAPEDFVMLFDPVEGVLQKTEVTPVYLTFTKWGVPIEDLVQFLYTGFNIPDRDCALIDTDQIFYRLENLELVMNEYHDAAYQRFLDLAIVFYVKISMSDTSIQSERITNQRMKEAGLSLSDLMRFANQNTPKLFPHTLCSLEDSCLNLLAQNPTLLNEPEVEFGLMCMFLEDIGIIPNLADHKRYMLGCKCGIYGSTAILYPDLLKNIGEQFQSDFYLLLNSQDEAMVEPITEYSDLDELVKEVAELTENYIEPKKLLSTHVYRYDRADGSLKIVQ